MNSWQVAQQLQYLLKARTWAGTGSIVFNAGSVLISQAMSSKVKPLMVLPSALIRIGEADSDPQEPDLLLQHFEVTVITGIPGDHVGERPLIGGNRASATVSEGRGLLEIEVEVFAAIKALGTDSGIVIVSMGAGAARPIIDPEVGYVAYRDYKFSAYTTASKFFHRARKIVATGGAAQIAVTWAVPPDRWDLNDLNLTYKTGATAPTSITDGTNIVLAKTATSRTITGLAAGTWSVSLFAGYDDLVDGTTANYSAALSKASITVT